MGRDRFGLLADIAIESKQGQQVVQRMRWIPPGRFMMGSLEEETRGLAKVKYQEEWIKREHPRHTVYITKGFWLADTPFTQALWEAVMHSNPSRNSSLVGVLRLKERKAKSKGHSFLVRSPTRRSRGSGVTLWPVSPCFVRPRPLARSMCV